MKCPLCGASRSSFQFSSHNRHGRKVIDKTDKFSVYQCRKCACIYLSGIKINDLYYKKYYETGYYEENSIQEKNSLFSILALLEKFSYTQKQNFILKNITSKKRPLKILDVGCGLGNFLQNLDSNIFEKSGVEIHERGIESSRKKGIQVYEGDIVDIDFKKKRFDVITLIHVLEHLKDPVKVFQTLHSLLEKDGLLLFSTPNTSGIGYQIGQEIWFHLDSPRHLILFNKKSSEYLCNQTKFQILKYKNEFYDYPLDLFWSIRSSKLKYLVYPFYPFIKYLDPEILTVICRKISG